MSQDKYLKYKNKYLALKKQSRQLGGGFRIGIKITDNARIRFGEALTEIIGTSKEFQIQSDDPVAEKLLEFCKNNDVTIRINHIVVNKDNFSWKAERYTIDYITPPSSSAAPSSAAAAPSSAAAAPSSAAAASSSAAVAPSSAAAASSSAAAASSSATFSTPFVRSVMKKQPVAAAAGAIDLIRDLNEREARVLEVYRCDAELANVTSNGRPIHTIFDTGNASTTQIPRSIIESLRARGHIIDIIPDAATTNNILGFNSVIDTFSPFNKRRKIKPLAQHIQPMAAVSRMGIGALAFLDAAACERAQAVQYEPTTLVQLHDILHSLDLKEDILPMCIDIIGFPRTLGFGAGEVVTLQLYHAFVPFELKTPEGELISFIVKASVVEHSDQLLLSHDDILKMTIRSGILVNFTDAGLSSKIKITNIRKDMNKLRSEIKILTNLLKSSRNNQHAQQQYNCKRSELQDKNEQLIQLMENKLPLQRIAKE